MKSRLYVALCLMARFFWSSMSWAGCRGGGRGVVDEDKESVFDEDVSIENGPIIRN